MRHAQHHPRARVLLCAAVAGLLAVTVAAGSPALAADTGTGTTSPPAVAPTCVLTYAEYVPVYGAMTTTTGPTTVTVTLRARTVVGRSYRRTRDGDWTAKVRVRTRTLARAAHTVTSTVPTEVTSRATATCSGVTATSEATSSADGTDSKRVVVNRDRKATTTGRYTASTKRSARTYARDLATARAQVNARTRACQAVSARSTTAVRSAARADGVDDATASAREKAAADAQSLALARLAELTPAP